MNRKLNRPSLRPFAWPLLTLALAGVLASGCVSINRLREAQDSFNQAAAAENATRFEANPADSAAALTSVRSGYASALLSLGKLEPKDQQSLQQDGLWGTALTLKALCQWRLGQYDPALSTANEAQISGTNQLYPRDRALLAALPGLIKTDQAYAKTLNQAPIDEVQALLVGAQGAVADLQNARALVDKDHPVQVYLLQAQLAAYRNFEVALDRLKNHATVDPSSPEHSAAAAQLKELDRLVKTYAPAPSGQELLTRWQKLCGLPPTP